jgi:integrase
MLVAVRGIDVDEPVGAVGCVLDSAATTMLEAGVPLRTVSELLGHSSVAVTGDVYGHVSSEGARSAVDRLSAAMGW